MDPDTALRELRAALAAVEDAGPDRDEEITALRQVAEYAQALDGWISAGGFLPSLWQAPPIRVLP